MRTSHAQGTDHGEPVGAKESNTILHPIVKNAFVSGGAGTGARLRVRPAHKASDRAYIPQNLPRNFYDDEWYNSLSQKEKDDLQAQPPMEMLEFEDDDD